MKLLLPGGSMKHPRVLLADDHTLLVEGFRKILEPSYDVVGTVKDGLVLLDAAPILKPDVILIDVAMPRLNGLDAGRRLKKMMPGVKLIFLTMNEDPDLAAEAMRNGASGYLLKTCAASELLDAIRAALKGKSYVTPKIARGMREAFIQNPQGKNPDKELTPRQREVIQLLAEGKSMKEAADILGVTPRTIAFHKYRMMEELGIKTNAELIRLGIKKLFLVA
jgi:DNA-binding NarL/FixJ family response regulator